MWGVEEFVRTWSLGLATWHMKLLGDPTTQHRWPVRSDRSVRSVRSVSSPPESACSLLGRCDVYSTCFGAAVNIGWLKALSRSLYSHRFIGIVWHLSSDLLVWVIIARLLMSPFMWLKRAPSKPQRMPMRANINISTMLYLVCCSALTPRTNSRILKETNWFGKKKRQQGKNEEIFGQIYVLIHCKWQKSACPMIVHLSVLFFHPSICRSLQCQMQTQQTQSNHKLH